VLLQFVDSRWIALLGVLGAIGGNAALGICATGGIAPTKGLGYRKERWYKSVSKILFGKFFLTDKRSRPLVEVNFWINVDFGCAVSVMGWMGQGVQVLL
jgi:hypothetical protein